MMDVIRWLANFLDDASVARAVFFALLSSFLLTQWGKYLLPQALPDPHHRAISMLMAAALGAGVCMAMWPGHQPNRLPISLLVGFSAPLSYRVVVSVLYHFFPWLEPILSARPRTS